VDHGVDAPYGGCERIHFEQVSRGKLDLSFAQGGGPRRIPYEGAYLVAALRKSFGESASDLSGRSSSEDFHVRNVAPGARRRLEKTDKRV
jgi:hypothetical protein